MTSYLWLRKRFSRSGRAATATALVIVYLIAALGVPLPTAQVKDRSQPFPCMDNPCGCASAAQCWERCCCTTPQERLAWARRHGVKPPAALAILAAMRSRPATGTSHSCCQTKAKAASHRDCCESEAEVAQVATQPLHSTSAPEQAGFIVVSAWRTCRGLAPLWSALGPALAPAPAVTYDFDWRLTGQVCLKSERSPSLSLPPAIPPPRA